MNKTGRGGISMRGGIDATFPLTQDQLNEVKLNSAMNIMKVVASYEGGERVAENAWNTIMNIACGDGTTERKPFERDDADILRAARTVSPNAVITSVSEMEHASQFQAAKSWNWITILNLSTTK